MGPGARPPLSRSIARRVSRTVRSAPSARTAYAVDIVYAVEVLEREHRFADDVVQPRAESKATMILHVPQHSLNKCNAETEQREMKPESSEQVT